MLDTSKKTSLRGRLLILSAAVLWGTTGTAQALGPEASQPLQVGALRLIVAAVVLGIVAGVRGSMRSTDLRRPATLVAGISMAAYQPLFFGAVAEIGVAVGTLIAIGSAPLFSGLIQRAVEGVRPTMRWVGASGVAVVGLGLLAGPGDDQVGVVGVGAALGAGLAYAAFASSMGRLREATATHSMAVVFGLAAVVGLPLLGTDQLTWARSASGLAMIGWLGVAATALAYLAFSHGLRTTDVNRATTLSLAEPVTATVLGVFVLGERPSILGLLGVLLIVTALFALVTERRTGTPLVA